MYTIKDKIVMITGADTGLGYSFAEILLRNGAKKIAVVNRSVTKGQKAAAALENEFGKSRAVFFGCDVTKADDLKKTFEKIVEQFEELDIIINNAGMANDKHWEEMIDLNVKALIRGSMLAFDYMGKHKGGKGGVIVNMASIAGLNPLYIMPIYSASKFAVVGFSKALANMYDKTEVRVVTICPGVTDTGRIKNVPNRMCDSVKAVIRDPERYFSSLPIQTTDNVAHATLDLIQKGETEQFGLAKVANRRTPWISCIIPSDLCPYKDDTCFPSFECT